MWTVQFNPREIRLENALKCQDERCGQRQPIFFNFNHSLDHGFYRFTYLFSPAFGDFLPATVSDLLEFKHFKICWKNVTFAFFVVASFSSNTKTKKTCQVYICYGALRRICGFDLVLCTVQQCHCSAKWQSQHSTHAFFAHFAFTSLFSTECAQIKLKDEK